MKMQSKSLLLKNVFCRKRFASVNLVSLVIVISAINATAYNLLLLKFAVENIEYGSLNGIQTLLTVFVIVFTVTGAMLFFLSAISTKLIQVVIPLVAISNAAAIYFMWKYGVILDKSMMGNILNTNYREASEFLSINLIATIILLGVLPALFFLSLKIEVSNRIKSVSSGVVLVLLCVVFTMIFSNSWLWIDKNAKVLGGVVLPWSYIANTARFISANNKRQLRQETLPGASHKDNNKTLVVLVIGETARAKNFSLYGYERNTNPLLTELDIVPMDNPVSCTTYTTGSLECLLSHKSETGPFSKSYEPLPSYLARHNVEVIWHTNNWGEPPISVTEYQKSGDLGVSCQGDGCKYDQVLLTGLEERIRSSDSDKILVVLHQKGSHGPAYHTRYPQEFERFKPVCKSVELNNCTKEELVNAYDNTILYTDYFLSETIGILERLADIPSVMMYLSDHGESLGENGLYLHGTPYLVAPKVQKEIPFLVWMSDQFRKLNNTSTEALLDRQYSSHFNVFHSVLSAFRMGSPIYDKDLDIFVRKITPEPH